MWVAWGCYLMTRNSGVVDLFWGMACFSVALCLLCFAPTWGWSQYVACFCVSLWALRLCGFLAVTRVLKGHRDPRYETLSEGWQSRAMGFLLNYTFQALLA